MPSADLVLAIHSLFVLGVILPVPLIILGKKLGWRWVHSLPFRLTHLLMIGIVVAESLLGIDCPLTLLENTLRGEAGETGYANGFVAHWLRRALFWEFPG